MIYYNKWSIWSDLIVGARVLKKTAETDSELAKAGEMLKRSKGSSKAKTPVFTLSRKQYSNHTRMLENAQKNGHSLEGLQRVSGTRAAQKNRYEAQKEIRKQQGPPPKGHDICIN